MLCYRFVCLQMAALFCLLAYAYAHLDLPVVAIWLCGVGAGVAVAEAFCHSPSRK